MRTINIKVIQDLNVQSIKNQHNHSLVSQIKQPCPQGREEALRVPCCKVPHNYVYVCQLHLSYQPEWIDLINPNSQSVSKWSTWTVLRVALEKTEDLQQQYCITADRFVFKLSLSNQVYPLIELRTCFQWRTYAGRRHLPCPQGSPSVRDSSTVERFQTERHVGASHS